MEAVEKSHKAQAKEYEKVLKVRNPPSLPPLTRPGQDPYLPSLPTLGQTISKPLKEGQHFDQSLGGIAGFFENMRANTESLVNTNIETEKSIKGSVLPVLERLHKEIKSKVKELAHGAQKGAKEVEKARNTTQKHIELLGQHTASFESTGGKMSPHDDPYVIQRGVIHRLNKQVLEENNQRNDLIAVQNNFQAFEAHVISVLQQAMEAFTQFVGGQAEKTRALYSDMLGAVQRIPPDFEWKGFVTRNADTLVNPNDPPRSVESVQFPNMNHTSTKALIEGSLERKSRNKLSWGFQTGYYVITPSKFLHEFKDSDNLRKDPTPELSIYLPDATIGLPNGEKFHVKGKDRSKTMSSKLTGASELSFKAHSASEASKWFEVIRSVASGPVEPSSPAVTTPSPGLEEGKKLEVDTGDHKGQEAGVITGGETVSSPTAVSPASPAATSATAATAPTAPTTADAVEAPVEKPVVAA